MWSRRIFVERLPLLRFNVVSPLLKDYQPRIDVRDNSAVLRILTLSKDLFEGFRRSLFSIFEVCRR